MSRYRPSVYPMFSDSPLGPKLLAAVLLLTLPGGSAHRGIAEEAQKDYVHAIADYGAAAALNPKDAGSLFFRGMGKLRNGDKTGGDADIASAKAIKPYIAEQYPNNTLK